MSDRKVDTYCPVCQNSASTTCKHPWHGKTTVATKDAESDILTDIRDVLEADVFKWLGSVVDKPKSMGGILQRAYEEIEHLRFENSGLEACANILAGQSDLAFPEPKTFRVKGFIVKVEPSK